MAVLMTGSCPPHCGAELTGTSSHWIHGVTAHKNPLTSYISSCFGEFLARPAPHQCKCFFVFFERGS